MPLLPIVKGDKIGDPNTALQKAADRRSFETICMLVAERTIQLCEMGWNKEKILIDIRKMISSE